MSALTQVEAAVETELSAWLGAQALGRYAGILDAKAVTLETLPDLTEEELAALGFHDFEESVPYLREAVDLSETDDVLTMSALFAAWLGEALNGAGRPLDALDVLRDAAARRTYRFCPNSEKHL